MRLADGPTVQTEIEIDAPRDVVWQLVTDLAAMGEFSPEYVGGEWNPPSDGPAVGARFTGTNARGDVTWQTTAEVIACEPERLFSFRIGNADDPSTTWRFQFHPTKAGGTRLVQSCALGTAQSPLTAAIADRPDREEVIVANRTAELLRNMSATLEALRAKATSVASV